MKQPLRHYLHIGQIVSVHGLRGEVKVKLLSSDPDRLDQLTSCFISSADETTHRPATIEKARKQTGTYLVKLSGTDDREAAELLRGQFLSVNREQALQLEEDEYFVCDLIGCLVYDTTHGLLGEVFDIQSHQAHDLYIVRDKGKKDLLFPAVKSVLHRIDLTARRIDVSLPDGLFDIYRS